jgi:hypothetical protein
MKRNYAVFAILIFTIFLLAESVSENLIKTVASNWINYIGEENYTIAELGFLQTHYPQTIYFVNFEPAGFVLLSSDDQAEPILAYQTITNINSALIPPATLQLLNHFSEQITFLRENQLKYPENETKWQHIFTNNFSDYHVKSRNVNPLITTKWNQGSPYNMYCPVMSGQNTLVGCVAVAMAQVMRFHQYPEHGYGSNSYTWNGQNVYANFASAYYNWANMPNQIYNSSPLIQRQAVATLLFHVGVGVNMDYGLDGSGSNSEYAKYALQYYFGYSPTIQLLNKDSVPIGQFTQILIDNLEASQPMYYAGHDGNMGHAFVCDGYQGTNYFHFNWGWSGSYDGYFYLHSLTPGYNNFNYGQQAIVSIKKPVVAYPPQNLTDMILGNDVILMWEMPVEINSLTGYNIYRNGLKIDFIPGVESVSYLDGGLLAGDYQYYITSQYYETQYVQPESEPSNMIQVSIGSNTTDDTVSSSCMLQNYPNPFNPVTTISFYLEKAGFITINIFNAKGEFVKTIAKSQFPAGRHNLQWDGIDFQTRNMPSGVYIYQLITADFIKNQKMILLK